MIQTRHHHFAPGLSETHREFLGYGTHHRAFLRSKLYTYVVMFGVNWVPRLSDVAARMSVVKVLSAL